MVFNGGCKSRFGFPLPLKSHCQQHKDLLISFTWNILCGGGRFYVPRQYFFSKSCFSSSSFRSFVFPVIVPGTGIHVSAVMGHICIYGINAKKLFKIRLT